MKRAAQDRLGENRIAESWSCSPRVLTGLLGC